VALEFVRLIAAQPALPQPTHLFVSARRPGGSVPPGGGAEQAAAAGGTLTAIDDDVEFVRAVHARYGGETLQMVLDNAELREMVVPMMRADFAAAEGYRMDPSAAPISTPVTAVGGTEDSLKPEELEGWGAVTSDWRGVTMVEGGHMFVNDPPPALSELLVKTLSKL